MTSIRTPIALTIAGSDSSGSAGIQADLKTFGALAVHGACVVAALTAQNTQAVESILPVPPEFVLAQMQAVASDIDVGAIKIGMLSTRDNIEAVAEGLKQFDETPVILDPVMASHRGDPLLDDSAMDTLKSVLIPRITLVTPNLFEAALLLGEEKARNVDAMAEQARKLRALGAKAVLVKGGHLDGEAIDVLLVDGVEERLEAPRHYTENTHGTGCTLSSAIAAGLAKGKPLKKAVKDAKVYVTAAIIAADDIAVGEGRGPLHHFHALWP
ncbi:MAG: bifunctional hydroxymethylpyrimidine kinase/phosphomethylpyrimidine kinase [Alphaproteobacteria bacterium]|jgi:hydroxymethylpyrimidine/phosphomethylpyrimidine kinase